MVKKGKEWKPGWKMMFMGAALMLCGFVWKYYGPELALAAGGLILFAKGFILAYLK
jgi:hypothetical protein